MASEKVIVAKQQQVAELKAKMEKAVAGVVVDYRGITVANDTKLRKELREAGIEYSVIKNNLLRRAADEVGLGEMTEILTGTTAFALSDSDPIAAAKILNKYAESSKGKYILKGGFMEGKVLDAKGVESLAKLPGKTELLTMLCMALNGNIRGLAVALNAVVEKQTAAETPE
ncbi:MAG: 50S ribosomal protein L10, partial [Angelakisella sp.]